ATFQRSSSDEIRRWPMTLMTIGQLARRAGVRPSAIRYYEAHGILPRLTRSSNAYRLYRPEAVALLRLAIQAKDLGFSLEEARQLIEAARNEPPCALIPRLSDQNPCAQPRMPIDIITQGWASNLFQAWQQ